LSGRGLCDELITRPEESYRLCCVVVCDLETSRMCAPYIYDISHLKVNKVRIFYTLILLNIKSHFYRHHFILISFTKRRNVGFEFTVVSVGLFIPVTSKLKTIDPLPCSLLWILRICLLRRAYKLNFKFLTMNRKKDGGLANLWGGNAIRAIQFWIQKLSVPSIYVKRQLQPCITCDIYDICDKRLKLLIYISVWYRATRNVKVHNPAITHWTKCSPK